MKIRSVSNDNRRRAFRVVSGRKCYWFPYVRTSAAPTPDDPVVKVFVDPELGGEAFTFVLRSGKEDSIHIEQVLDYNRDPGYIRRQLLYRLTLDAQRLVATSPLSRREIIRRLGTSPAQFYRLLDQKNSRKTVDRMLDLLSVLGCEVAVDVRAKSA